MRIEIIGAGAVGSACLAAVLMRGFAREVVVLDRDRKRARGLVMDIQYGASQHGIGMVAARIAEIVWHDERRVIPVGSYNPRYRVTLSLPGVVGRDGMLQVLEPEMSEEERKALLWSGETLQAANSRIPIVYGI